VSRQTNASNPLGRSIVRLDQLRLVTDWLPSRLRASAASSRLWTPNLT
jgi:hypothetical protein